MKKYINIRSSLRQPLRQLARAQVSGLWPAMYSRKMLYAPRAHAAAGALRCARDKMTDQNTTRLHLQVNTHTHAWSTAQE